MTADLDRAVRSSLGDIIATAPEPDDQPMRPGADGSETRTRRPYLAVAASLVVLAGVGALVAVSTNDATPVSPAVAPIATDDSSASEPLTAPTTITVPGDTASSVVVNTTPSCAITGAQALVPNVAGMPWVDADAALVTAGLEPNALPELPAPLEDATDADYYVIIRQETAPGTITPCGTTVDITVAYRPGTLYIVQEGDTYESIAASQGIPLEQLLGFNGLSVAALEASGRSPDALLALGQALRLGPCPTSEACSGPSTDPATLNTAPTTTTS
jgi:LysM domain/PASTA domain